MPDWTLRNWIEVAGGLLWVAAAVTAIVCGWRLPSETRVDPKTGRRFPYSSGGYNDLFPPPSWFEDIYTPTGNRLRATMWWALGIMVAELVLLYLLIG